MDDTVFDQARRLGIKIKDPRYERLCELESLLSDLFAYRRGAEEAGENTTAADMAIDQVRKEIEELSSNRGTTK